MMTMSNFFDVQRHQAFDGSFSKSTTTSANINSCGGDDDTKRIFMYHADIDDTKLRPSSFHHNHRNFGSPVDCTSGFQQSVDVNKAVSTTAVTNSFAQAKLPFPWKLHQLLDDVDRSSRDGYNISQTHTQSAQQWHDVVSWMPDGKSFRVHQPGIFAETIMRQYFKMSKYSSFTRQVRECNGNLTII
jgi:HSF-type DNA-binding